MSMTEHKHLGRDGTVYYIVDDGKRFEVYRDADDHDDFVGRYTSMAAAKIAADEDSEEFMPSEERFI